MSKLMLFPSHVRVMTCTSLLDWPGLVPGLFLWGNGKSIVTVKVDNTTLVGGVRPCSIRPPIISKFYLRIIFFAAPADRNYFLARFAKSYGMNEEFWWQSLQAAEKYLKAGLILNSVRVKNLGHNLEKLWQRQVDTFGDCAVINISDHMKWSLDFVNIGHDAERMFRELLDAKGPDYRKSLPAANH